MECIITEKVTQAKLDIGERHISRIIGESTIKLPKSVVYTNTVTGEKYLTLAGGFAWPGTRPGFAVVVGVQNIEAPVYRVITDIEEIDVRVLVRGGFALYQQYGMNCREIPWQWYGDPDHGLNQFARDFNRGRRTPRQMFYLTHPLHFGDPDQFGIYCRLILSMLQRQEKRLFLGDCDRLRSYFNVLDSEMVVKGKVEDYPAVAALGYVLSALHQYEPWLRKTAVEIPHGSYEDEYEAYLSREAWNERYEAGGIIDEPVDRVEGDYVCDVE